MAQSPSPGFVFALGIVAGHTQALHVAVIIQATFSQGRDVIALSGQCDPSLTLAFSTQWR
jgi:hypothetical protein